MTVHPERIKSSDLVESPETARVSSPALVSRLHEWITTVDHKKLGIMYILYALLFLVIGGHETTADRARRRAQALLRVPSQRRRSVCAGVAQSATARRATFRTRDGRGAASGAFAGTR